MNNRRRFLLALGGGTITAPFASIAQQKAKVWRIGVLYPRARPAPGPGAFAYFFEELRDLGYVDGRNIAVEWEVAENDPQRLPELASKLVNRNVDLIVTQGTVPVRAVQQATATVPILSLTFGDPVALGFAKSLPRPGGNITGISIVDTELQGKRLEILIEIVPHVARIGYLINPDNPIQMKQLVPEIEKHARRANKEIVIGKARGGLELDAAFAQIVRDRAGAVLIALDPVFIDHIKRFAELALEHRLPSMFGLPEGGTYGLASYGPDFRQAARSAAMMAVKIIKGTKPENIPIERPTRFDLVVNLKTAKALGVTIPPAVMVQATKVIE